MSSLSTIGLAMFCAGAAWIAYVFAGYPVLVWLWGRVRPVRPVRRRMELPKVSVLIAARNEAKDIGWKIRETLSWDYPADRLDVLVASDASEDGTDEVVESFRGSRVRLVRMPVRGGKVRALNCLADMTDAELLFFTDANAHIAPHVLRRMVAQFEDPRVGCVTGRTRTGDRESAPVAAGAHVYWDYEALVATLESRLGAVLVCDGAIHCARRHLVGRLSPDLANDLELPVMVRACGFYTVFEPEAVVVESEMQSPGQEYTRRRRICGQGALALWRLRSLLGPAIIWQFVSRKVLRWLIAIPLFLVLGGSALMVREPFFATALAFQTVFYGMALAAHILHPPIGPFLAAPFYIVLGAAGALRGVLDTLGGRRFDVWEIAALSRGRH